MKSQKLVTALLLLGAFLYGLSAWKMPAHDPDLGWHLFGGATILEQFAVPRADPINAFNSYWVDYHWLVQIAMYLLYAWSGFTALKVALGIVTGFIALLVLSIIQQSCRNKLYILPQLILFIASMRLINEVVSIRPQMISLLAIALALLVLLRPGTRFRLTIFFILALLLSNIHVYWVLLPGLWLAWMGSKRICNPNAISRAYAWGGALLLFSAGFLSPYGIFADAQAPFGIFSNYALLLDYAHGTAELKDSIGEFKSSLAVEGAVPWIFLGAIAVCFFALKLPRHVKYFQYNFAKIARCLLSVGSIVLAVRTLKFMATCAIFSLPTLTRAALKICSRHQLDVFRYADSVILALLFVCYSAASAAYYSPWLFDTTAYLEEVPYAACAKIPAILKNTRPRADGKSSDYRVMTHFNYGGWCKFGAFEAEGNFPLKVTTDGRTQFVPVEHYVLSFDLYRMNYDWMNTLVNWAPDIILVEKQRALAQYLVRTQNAWRLVYQDEKFALFVPKE